MSSWVKFTLLHARKSCPSCPILIDEEATEARGRRPWGRVPLPQMHPGSHTNHDSERCTSDPQAAGLHVTGPLSHPLQSEARVTEVSPQ